MAVDFTIDNLSHAIFSSIWEKHGLHIQHDLTKVFQYSISLEDYSFYDPIITAVRCRQVLFREVYKKKFARDARMYVTSASDFNDYLRRSFTEPCFENLTVFELVYASCAFVAELTLYCKFLGKSDWIISGQIAHLCWALYFDTEKRDLFYSKGAFSMLRTIAASYRHPYEFILIYWRKSANSYESISIEKMVNGMNEFKQLLNVDHMFTGHETAAKEGKSATTTENSYDCNTIEGLERILFDLKRFCDPFQSLDSDLKSLCMDKTEVDNALVSDETQDKNEQQSSSINATQLEQKSSSNREIYTKRIQESTFTQIDHFERIWKSRSISARSDEGNLGGECNFGNYSKRKVLSSDTEVNEQISNKNLPQIGSLTIGRKLSPSAHLEDTASVIKTHNGENQTTTLNEKRLNLSPLQSEGNRQTMLDKTRSDVGPLQSKLIRPDISPLQSKEMRQTMLDEKSPDVSPLQRKENRPDISPLESKGNRQTILSKKIPGDSQLQSSETGHTMLSEKLNEQELNKIVSPTFSSVTTKKEDQPIVSPLQSKIKRLSLSNEQGNSPDGGFSSPLANQESKLRNQIVGNVYVSPVQDKENQQNLPNAVVLLEDENLSETNDAFIVQYQGSSKGSKENNRKILRTIETGTNSATVESDFDVTDDASQSKIPGETEKPKKKTKKKKRKGTKVETNNPPAKSQTPQVKEKDSDDVKDLLRLMLVLGDKTGVAYVRSTLRKKSDKEPISEQDLQKLFKAANPPPEW